jgi:hypothetical protein
MGTPMIAEPMTLMDDDDVAVERKGQEYVYRIRVWRAHARPAVVLVSPVVAGPPCSYATCRLADLAYSQYLGFLPEGMHFFEHEGGKLWRVTFEGLGDLARCRFVHPRNESVGVHEIELLVGRPIDL